MRTLMRRLIAAKSHRYGTRQLVAGDEYEASGLHSRILVGARLARYAPEQPERSPLLMRANQPAPIPTALDDTAEVTAPPAKARAPTSQARVGTAPTQPREPRK